ncbi:MAG: glucose PTS transporter subunit IIA, partial [Firmicutes bacterium]|nr:glucose PTS transporter subunit IIA [Bacillota bacterium]
APLVGGGLIKGILAILVATGAVKEGEKLPDLYIVFNAMGDAVFYFLPVLLGFSAGKKFGASPYLTAVLGAVLIYPGLNEASHAFGNPDFKPFGFAFTLVNFSSTVLPIILASYACAYLEKFLRKHTPDAIVNFTTPMLCIIIIIPLTLIIVGPASDWVAQNLAKGISSTPVWITGFIMGGFWQVLVIFGLHWAFIPIIINNIIVNKHDLLLGSSGGAAPMAQAAAAFAMAIKMKNKKAKSNAISSGISGIFGITEPIIYGLTLPRKTPFILGCVGGAIGGMVAALLGADTYMMGALGILGLPSTIHPEIGITMAFWGTVIGLAVTVVISFVLVYIFYKDDTVEMNGELVVDGNLATGTLKMNVENNGVMKMSKHTNNLLTILSPLKGEFKPINQCSDPVFAEEIMGKGILIIPQDGKLYAPCDSKLTVVASTKHMIGLTTNQGVEIILHLGIDTVKLDGKYYEVNCKAGDDVIAGQLLVEFDIEKIKAEGFSVESPIIITSLGKFSDMRIVAGEQLKVGDAIIDLQ